MKHSISCAFARTAAMAAALALVIIPASAQATGGWQPSPDVRSVSYNLYVGADIFKVFEADPTNPLGIPIKVAEIYQDVLDTNFAERAHAIAEQVAIADPDLIGLQEVSVIVELDPGFNVVNYLDYLALLQAALADAGLNYEVANVVANADVTMPSLAGFNGQNPIIHYVALTDRDVILRKSDVTVSDAASGNYVERFSINVMGVDVEFSRGWVAVDANVRGRDYRFVNTHLEVQGDGVIISPTIQAAQASELIDLLANEDLPVVLVGDFNSSIDDPVGQPYSLLTDAGYVDSWTHRYPDLGPGYTCCQEADLLNADSVLDERVDLIFVRDDQGSLPFTIFYVADAEALGDEPADKSSPSDLWPSDHAGVSAVVRITSCGLGFEIALVLPVLMVWRRRRITG